MPSYVTPKTPPHTCFTRAWRTKPTPAIQGVTTLAAGDVMVATGNGAPGNITTLPTVDADFTKRLKVNMSAAEMNGDNVTVLFSDAAGAEWLDLKVNLQTTASQIDDLATAAAVASIGSGTGAALNFAAGTDNTGGAIKSVTFVGSQALTYAAPRRRMARGTVSRTAAAPPTLTLSTSLTLAPAAMRPKSSGRATSPTPIL